MRANPTKSQTAADDPLSQSPQPAVEPERLLGRYQLIKQLGSGAFGTVWLARDERLDRDVAVKSLPREHVIHERFEREARAAARLQHPAIVTLYEAAVDDEGAYLVSELVRGRTLDRVLDAGKLSDRDIVEVGLTLCRALDHAHEHGVIHRDVKPSNILVPSRATGGVRAKLTDFGVAQVVGSGSLTRAGDVIGTLAYMSPEQAAGHEVTGSADLFALALVLYEALSGVNPLQERTIAVRGRQRTPFIPPLRRQRRDLPRTLAGGIDRALSERTADRGTLADLHAVLERSLPEVDDVAGVVAPGWRGESVETQVQGPGPEWREPAGPQTAATRMVTAGAGASQHRQLTRRMRDEVPGAGPDAREGEAAGGLADGARRPYRRPPPARESLPDWLPRAAGAAAAGVVAALLCMHLLDSSPLAPASAGLIVAAAVLLLPRLASTAAVIAFAALAVEQNRTGGGLLLAAVALPAFLLTWHRGQAPALPALAPLLGMIGLAGAFPALAGRGAFTWVQRAVFGGAGYIWMLYASALMGRVLYWWPGHATAAASGISAARAGTPGLPPPAHAWIGSAHAAYELLVLPLIHSSGLAAAAVWAAAAVLLPLIRSRRWPVLDLLLASAWSLLTLLAVEAIGANDPHAAVLGAAVGWVLAAWPALAAISRDLRYGAGQPATAL